MYMLVLLNLAMVSLLVAAQPAKGCGPGALEIYTSEMPLAREARELIANGQLARATQRLEEVNMWRDAATTRVVASGLEVIRRIRHDYSLEKADLLQRIQKEIPDATTTDLDHWIEAGQVQYLTLDGKRCFFRREPGNIWRFCDDARQRRNKAAGRPPDEPKPISASRRNLIRHIEQIVAEAEAADKDQVLPMRFGIKYRVTVPTEGIDAKPGSVVRCWLPYPQEYRQQRDVRLRSSMPDRPTISPNGSGHRSVYLEQRVKRPGENVTFQVEFEYVSSAYYPRLDDAKVKPLPGDFPDVYLAERPPHIAFTSELQAKVREIVGDETNPLAKARRIFGWIDENIRYCSEMEYGIIPGFSTKVFESGRGDCGVQSILFITMCRAAGVPARWQSGWVTQPHDWNMHDWAEIYVEPWGWLPMDVSFGLIKSRDPLVRWFYFGHLDVYRLIVNMDYGCTFKPPKKDFRSEPADFQRGEVEIDGRNLYFNQWDWEFQVTAEPI